MRVELRDSLEFLFSDSEVGRRACEVMDLDVARGGTAAAHVLINGLAAGKRLRVSEAACALRSAARAGRQRMVLHLLLPRGTLVEPAAGHGAASACAVRVGGGSVPA